MNVDQDAWEIAEACRAGIDREFYGGTAPNDSNALTEVWSTRSGVGFTVQRHGRMFGVLVDVTDG